MNDPNGPEGKNTKPSNPKDAAAFGKRIDWAVIPWRALVGACLALAEGAWKYGRHNYRPAGVRASVYFSAVMRHMFAWWEGQDIDPASRLNHIDKAIAGLLVLRDSMLENNWEDDRPPRVAGDFIEAANKAYADLGERMLAEHGQAKAPFRHLTPEPRLVGSDPTSGVLRWGPPVQLGTPHVQKRPFSEVLERVADDAIDLP